MKYATFYLVLATVLATSLASPAPSFKDAGEKVDDGLEEVLGWVGGAIEKGKKVVTEVVKNTIAGFSKIVSDEWDIINDLNEIIDRDFDKIEAAALEYSPESRKTFKELRAKGTSLLEDMKANAFKMAKALERKNKEEVRRLEKVMKEKRELLEKVIRKLIDILKKLKEKLGQETGEEFLQVLEKAIRLLEQLGKKVKSIIQKILEKVAEFLRNVELYELKERLIKRIKELKAMIKQAVEDLVKILKEKGVSEKAIKFLLKLVEEFKRLLLKFLECISRFVDCLLKGERVKETYDELVKTLEEFIKSIADLVEHCRDTEEIRPIVAENNKLPIMVECLSGTLKELIEFLKSTDSFDISGLIESWKNLDGLNVNVTA